MSDLLQQLESGVGWSALPLDVMVVALAALALALCILWLVAITLATAVEAVTGASSAVLRAVSPQVVRRLVLMSCGIAVGSAGLLPPATAADHSTSSTGTSSTGTSSTGTSVARYGTAALTGLPLPDRALGEAPPAAPMPPHRAVTQPAPRLVTVAAVAPRQTSYVVRPGDSLWDIATRFLPGADPLETDAAWRRIHRANRDVIGPDPDLIIPGTTLRIPPQAAAARQHRKDAS